MTRKKKHGRAPVATPRSAQAFMLSNLKASAGKFVLGPPVETEPPIMVFTGPADKPDAVEQTVASGKTKHARKKKIAAHPKKKAAEAGRQESRGGRPPARKSRPSTPRRKSPRPPNERARGQRAAPAARPDPADRAHRLPRRRQDHAAQPPAEGPGARRDRRHHQRIRRGRARPSAGRICRRQHGAAAVGLPVLHHARRPGRRAGDAAARSRQPALHIPAACCWRPPASPIRRRCCTPRWRIPIWCCATGSTAW